MTVGEPNEMNLPDMEGIPPMSGIPLPFWFLVED
jgi:hypothetical protein